MSCKAAAGRASGCLSPRYVPKTEPFVPVAGPSFASAPTMRVICPCPSPSPPLRSLSLPGHRRAARRGQDLVRERRRRPRLHLLRRDAGPGPVAAAPGDGPVAGQRAQLLHALGPHRPAAPAAHAPPPRRPWDPPANTRCARRARCIGGAGDAVGTAAGAAQPSRRLALPTAPAATPPARAGGGRLGHEPQGTTFNPPVCQATPTSPSGTSHMPTSPPGTPHPPPHLTPRPFRWWRVC